MGPGIPVIERERADGMFATGRQALVTRNPSHVRRIDEAESKQALRRCEVRPNVHELLEERYCRRRIRPGDPGEERASTHHQIPGPQCRGRLRRARAFGSEYVALERSGD